MKNQASLHNEALMEINIIKGAEETAPAMLNEECQRRTHVAKELWSLLGTDIPELCRFTRIEIHNFSVKEFAAALGVKPLQIKRLERNDIANENIPSSTVMALFGFLMLNKGGDIEKIEKRIAILKENEFIEREEARCKSELLVLMDAVKGDTQAFLSALTEKHSLSEKSLAFVLDEKDESRLSELKSGISEDSRKWFCAFEYNIDRHASLLAEELLVRSQSQE